jgi:hypothetical protein
MGLGTPNVLFVFDIVTAAAIGNTHFVSHHFRWGRYDNVPVQPGLDTALLNRGFSWHRDALREIRECELALWAGERVDRLQVRGGIPSAYL